MELSSCSFNRDQGRKELGAGLIVDGVELLVGELSSIKDGMSRPMLF